MNLPNIRSIKACGFYLNADTIGRLIGIANLWVFILAAGLLRAAPPGDPNTWTLVWSDEFNGATNSTPTSALWGSTSQLPWGGNFAGGSYASAVEAADCYEDGNGHLVLRCRYGTFAKSSGGNASYSEGMLNNLNINNLTYGYVEVSAKYPTTPSSQWPAFWLNSAATWPPEVDIAEYFSDTGSDAGYMHQAVAWTGPTWDSTTEYAGNYGSYHAYGVDWGEGYLNWYIDGANSKANSTAADVPAQPMYIILNSGVATSPTPGSSGYPTYSYFDYCRYYRRSELVYNSDFQAYYASWNLANNASAASGQGVGGSVGMRLDTDSSGVVNSTASQTVYGLLPNTTYILTSWYHNDSSVNSWWPGLNVGVTSTGGGTLLNTAWGANPNWTQGSSSFTTGPLPTNATVSFQVQPTWGRMYLDNVLLQRANTVNNPGFETSYDGPYWQTSGNSYLLQYSARSGSYAQQFHTNSSAWQVVAGLLTNTTYNLKVWVTGPNWPGLQVSVTNADGVNAGTTVYPNGAYQSGTLSFTTKASATTATIILANGVQSSDYVYFADDLFLAQPLNPPWQGQDIGAVVQAGASGRRGTQFAIEGSGADVWGTNDALYYVYQPLTNDGQITAQIRTEQNTSANAKCGVMMRQSLDQGAPHFFVDLLPQQVVETLWRSTPVGATTAYWVTNIQVDPWVRVQRNGNLFAGYYSLDGTNWIQTTQQAITMSNTILMGLAVNSHNTNLMNESIFNNVSAITCGVTATPLVSQTNCPGGSVTFSTTPGGTGPFTYIWTKNASVLANQNGNSLTFNSVAATNAGTYAVQVYGACGSATNSASLVVNMPVTATPLIDQTNNIGNTVEFSTTAGGTGPFTYVWSKNGTVIAGQTASSLIFTNVTATNAGNYAVQVFGECGSVTTGAALVLDTVTQPVNLTATCAGAGIVLQWPTTATGFILETKSDLSSGTGWLPVGALVATNNGFNTITVPISNDTSFFRLSK